MHDYSNRKWLGIKKVGGFYEICRKDISEQNDFTIITWNILAKSHIDRNRYSHCKDENLQEEARKKLTIKEISDLNPDLLLLQEVEPSSYYSEKLGELGYMSSYHRRPGKRDGSMILWKESKFAILEKQNYNLDEDLFALEGRDLNNYQISTGSIGAFCVLKHKNTNKKIILGTGHLYWLPCADLVRLRQWLYYLQKLEDLKKTWENSCAILAADFNTKNGSHAFLLMLGKIKPSIEYFPEIYDSFSFDKVPDSIKPLYDEGINRVMLSKKQPDISSILDSWKRLNIKNLIDVYCSFSAIDVSPSLPCPSYDVRVKGVDHILVENDKIVTKAILEIPIKRISSIEDAIPNESCPSDHFPIGAIVSFAQDNIE